MRKTLVTLGLLLLPAVVAGQGLDKYMEMLRSDLRTQKTEMLTDALKLTDAQAPKFWPIQREYETELAKIQDARIAMIKDYAKNYDNMTDAKATELMSQVFKLEDQRNALLKKYAGKVAKAVSPMEAARFVQVEKLVQSLLDVQVRGDVPLIP